MLDIYAMRPKHEREHRESQCTCFDILDRELRQIDIDESDTKPLVEISLFYSYRMQLDAIEDSTVTIQSLSSLS
jgi:hypothetical protein